MTRRDYTRATGLDGLVHQLNAYRGTVCSVWASLLRDDPSPSIVTCWWCLAGRVSSVR